MHLLTVRHKSKQIVTYRMTRKTFRYSLVGSLELLLPTRSNQKFTMNIKRKLQKLKLIALSLFLRIWFTIIINFTYFYVFCSCFPFKHPLNRQELLLPTQTQFLFCCVSLTIALIMIIITLLLPLLPQSFTAQACYVSLAIIRFNRCTNYYLVDDDDVSRSYYYYCH